MTCPRCGEESPKENKVLPQICGRCGFMWSVGPEGVRIYWLDWEMAMSVEVPEGTMPVLREEQE